MKQYRKNLMVSDVEESSNLMLTRLTPVATQVEQNAWIHFSDYTRPMILLLLIIYY